MLKRLTRAPVGAQTCAQGHDGPVRQCWQSRPPPLQGPREPKASTLFFFSQVVHTKTLSKEGKNRRAGVISDPVRESDTKVVAGVGVGEGVTVCLGLDRVFFEAWPVSKEGVQYICIGG